MTRRQLLAIPALLAVPAPAEAVPLPRPRAIPVHWTQVRAGVHRTVVVPELARWGAR